MRYRMMFLMVMFCTASIAACSSTMINSVWKDEAYRTQPKRVLVIAMFKNETIRRLVEDEFKNYLKYGGTDAATGYEVIPGNGLPTKETVVEQIKAKGFDALLLTRLIDTRTETRTISGGYAPPSYVATMNGYYGSAYSTVYSPSYQVEDRYATVESRLYDAATEKLVWTATSDTWLSGEDLKTAKTYVAVMMDSLRKQKLFP